MVLQGLKSRIFDRLNKYAERWVTEVPTTRIGADIRDVLRLSRAYWASSVQTKASVLLRSL